MAALGRDPAQVRDVLTDNNFLAGIGQTKGDYVAIDLSRHHRRERGRRTSGTSWCGRTATRWCGSGTSPTAGSGAEDYDSTTWYKGKTAIFAAIQQAPGANPLTVARPDARRAAGDQAADAVRAASAASPTTPANSSRTPSTRSSAPWARRVLIVLVVIFLTLGSMRAALVPARGGAPVADRRRVPHAAAGFFPEHADPAGHGAGHRAGGGRRDHRGRERAPPHRARRIRPPGRDSRGARAWRCRSSP